MYSDETSGIDARRTPNKYFHCFCARRNLMASLQASKHHHHKFICTQSPCKSPPYFKILEPCGPQPEVLLKEVLECTQGPPLEVRAKRNGRATLKKKHLNILRFELMVGGVGPPRPVVKLWGFRVPLIILIAYSGLPVGLIGHMFLCNDSYVTDSGPMSGENRYLV